MTHKLIPGQQVPNIELELLDGETWRLSEQQPRLFTLIDVYRGIHCGRCRIHLEEMAKQLPSFAELGVDVIAMSMDDETGARQTKQDWALGDMTVGYGLTMNQGKTLDLFFSEAIRESEPNIFCEPAILFIQPDGQLYGTVQNSFPFARPSVNDLVEVATVVRDRDYPPRGTHVR